MRAARRRAVLAAAARDDDVLPAVDHVGRRRRVAGRGQRRLPEQLAGQLVVGAELLVEVRRADEQQAARGDDRAAVVVAAGVGQPLRGQLGILAERDLPADRAGVEIDRVQRAPRRRDRRIAVRIEQQMCSRRCGTSASSDRFVTAGSAALSLPVMRKSTRSLMLRAAHVGECRHAAGALADDRRDLLARAGASPMPTSDGAAGEPCDPSPWQRRALRCCRARCRCSGRAGRSTASRSS